jgi:hypothetical protein
MDRRQMVVQWVRECFTDRLDDVLHQVRQDRQELRGWQEPAHLRGTLRRAVRESGSPQAEQAVVSVEAEFGRGAAEPDRGQQRETLGQILEAAENALRKTTQQDRPELNGSEVLGLECALVLYGRPAVLVQQGRLASVPAFWNILEDQREDIELAQRGVGRIELMGHPDYDWAGTGFLVSESVLLTTRRVAEVFTEMNRGGGWQFRPGISAWMNYQEDYQQPPSAAYRIRQVIGIHERYDLALFEVEPPQISNGSPAPLALAAQAPERLEGRQVYMVGYPIREGRRNEPERLARVFRDVYNVKRVQPGLLRGGMTFNDVQLLRHDCGLLGQSSGSCLLDLETHQVLGMHLSGRYLEPGVAVPIWALRDDPLLQRAGVTFACARKQEVEETQAQLERLARSRFWNDVRNTIASLYQRAFGNNPNYRT